MHPNSEQYYIYGVNFASAGAGALVETAQGEVVDLNMQVSYYKNVRNLLRKKLGNAETKALLSKAVHLFSIGSNDYGDLFIAKSTVDIVIGNLTIAIKEIHNLGGRKFGFVNLGPFGCSPVSRLRSKGGCIEEFLAVARLHNNELSKVLLKLEKELQGFKYSVFDFFNAASQVMEHPSKYGFKEGKAACCGGGPYRGDRSCGGKRGIKKYELCENVNEYLFFDSGHPTDRVNQHFSQLMWNGNRTVNNPHNLKEIFGF